MDNNNKSYTFNKVEYKDRISIHINIYKNIDDKKTKTMISSIKTKLNNLYNKSENNDKIIDDKQEFNKIVKVFSDIFMNIYNKIYNGEKYSYAGQADTVRLQGYVKELNGDVELWIKYVNASMDSKAWFNKNGRMTITKIKSQWNDITAIVNGTYNNNKKNNSYAGDNVDLSKYKDSI